MTKKNWHIFISPRLKKIAAILVGVIGLLYLEQGILLWSLAKQSPTMGSDTEIEISIRPEVKEAQTDELPAALRPSTQKLSFEEYCKKNPISTCWDNKKPTDFLYQEDQTATLKPTEPTANLPEEPQNIEESYEEPLPEDIIEANDVYTSKIYGMQIIPARKPPHFAKPVLAIVIDDMGISLSRTKAIGSLQAPLTASFLTYATKLESQIKYSQQNNQEIMLHIPMEAHTYKDVAPDVLTTAMSAEQIEQRLKQSLNRFPQIRGVNNHMGSKLTEDDERMKIVMKVLKEKNVFFLDSKTSAKSVAEKNAKEQNIAYAHRHVFIDNNNDKAYILGQIKKAEAIALKNGYAIAIGHPKTQTIEALKEWLAEEEHKVTLVHLSDIIHTLHPQF